MVIWTTDTIESMNREDTTPLLSAALADPTLIRHADRATLARALQDARDHTTAQFAAYEAALQPGFDVPMRPVLNPPLWELGHVAWFQEWWIARNTQRAHGRHADAEANRLPSMLPQADIWYNSSTVGHPSRWALPQLDLAQTQSYLDTTLKQTLSLLERTPNTDADLYFYRLCLAHEDMHGEAFSMMALDLGLIAPAQLPCSVRPIRQLVVEAHRWLTGSSDAGFSFDNERGEHEVALARFEIDSDLVTRAEFSQYLSATGQFERASQCASDSRAPGSPMTHVTLTDAQAYCAWRGRRLPTEHEWEAAQHQHGGAFSWGQAWEWTASSFEAYPGFTMDPYREYSQPWFGNHSVLKGGSLWSRPRMRHPRYRNFFLPHRVDVLSGFRTAASS